METKALQHNPQHSTCLRTRGVQKPNQPIKTIPPNSTQEHLLDLNRAFGWIWVLRWKHHRISSDVSFHSFKWTQPNQYKPYQYTWHYVIDCIDFPFLLLTCIPYPLPSSLSLPQSICLPQYLPLIASASTKENFDLETIRMACPRWRSIWKGIY